MELIERYIYAVTHRLPASQRADIEKELRSLIDDLLEERTRGREGATEEVVEQILMELGHPQAMADRYRGEKRYLIGPDLLPSYIIVLKIAMISVSIAMLVVFAIDTILQPNLVLEHLIDSMVNLLMGNLQAFAWVTIIFAILDYPSIRRRMSGTTTEKWQPAQLPELPDYRTQIKRREPIIGIIFSILVGALCTFSIDRIGVWRIQGVDTSVIPIFDKQVFQLYLPVILLVIAVSILKNCTLLLKGRWTISIIGLEILLTVLCYGVSLWMLSDQHIWNQHLMQQLVDTGVVTASSEAYEVIESIWTSIHRYILPVLGIMFFFQLFAWIRKAYLIRSIGTLHT